MTNQTEVKLPELPPGQIMHREIQEIGGTAYIQTIHSFSADQMREYAILAIAQKCRLSEMKDVADAARYRKFKSCGLPITYCGVDYHTGEELDAAIDADISKEKT